MGRDIRLLIAAQVDTAEQQIRQLQRTGADAASILEKDFEALGVRSSLSYERQRAAAVAAYDRIKASGVASATEIARAQQAMEAKVGAIDGQSRLRMMGAEARETTASVNTLSTGFGSLQAIIASVGITAFISSLRSARIEMDAIENSMAASVQSEALAGQEMAFVAAWSEKMGLSLRQTTQDYAQMTAAAKGTAIEGDGTRKVFQGVTTAATALHLSADRVHNIMVALNQMMSKGTVQTEELKGQLGESLPGAYNMAAKAMGLTTAELSKQLEKGEIMASDLLPKLAAEMEARFGKQIPKAIQSTQAEMNRLENATFNLKLALADSGLFAALAKGSRESVEGMQTLVMWMGQAKVFWGSMVDKSVAWVNAGGLIGMLKGGPAARAELKAEFDAIDALAEASWNKWLERGGQKQPLLDPKALEAKRQQEIDAAEAKRREAAEKARKENEKLQEKELAVFKASQEEKTALVKAQKASEMAVLKGQYEQGLVTTADYYAAEKALAVAAAETKLQSARDYLEKEEALLATIRKRSKKGDKDLDVQEELAKHEKAVKAVAVAEQDLAKVVTEEGNKETKALRDRTDEYRKLSIAALEASGRFVEAEAMRQEGDRQGANYLRLKLEALKDTAGASEALAAQERADAVKVAQARTKEAEELRGYTAAVAALQAELDKLSGKDQALLDKEAELRAGRDKLAALQERIAVAWSQGNAAAIGGLSQQIQLQDQLNARLRQSLDLQQDLAVLSGKIVGFDNGKPIYANEGGAFVNGKPVDPYQSRSGGSGFTPVTPGSAISGSSPFVSLTDPWFGGGRANGGPVEPFRTYVVGERGPEVLRMGSQGGSVIPNAAGGAVNQFSGPIQIILPNVTDRSRAADLARELYPELQKLDRRKRAS